MTDKPNIFSLAPTELSQDAFFTWLLQRADNSHSQPDQQLNESAKDFVRLLLGQTPDFQISKVEVGIQWHNIDIWAEINDEYFIGIVDKKNTGEHSEQLERCKEFAIEHYANEHYKDKNYKLVFVYLKTGNESSATPEKIAEKGYSIIDRTAVLSVLNKRQVTNEIFNEFKEYLTGIENATNSFNLENIISDGKAGEYFFKKLQEHIKIKGANWKYVNNPRGRFLHFTYHWVWVDENGTLFIQIENAFEHGIKLAIRIHEWVEEPSIDILKEMHTKLKPYAEKNGLDIAEPDAYRLGKKSTQAATFAIVQKAFPVDNNGNIELEKFVSTLKKLEQTIDEYSIEANEAQQG